MYGGNVNIRSLTTPQTRRRAY